MTKIYTVRNQAGETFEVDEDKLSHAEQDGYFPVVRQGEQEYPVAQKDLQKAIEDGFEPMVRNDVSKTESAIRGAAQGLTLGLGDEIGGVAKTITQTAFGPDKLADFVKNYYGFRNQIRENNKIAQAENPGSYGAGEFAGAGATAIANPAAGIGRLATLGALQGAGYSEADTVPGIIKDTGLGAVTGATIGKVGQGIEKVGQGIGKVADKISSVDARALSTGARNLGTELVDSAKGITPIAAVEGLIGGVTLPTSTVGAFAAGKLLQHSGGAIEKGTQAAQSALNLVEKYGAKLGKYQGVLKDAAARGTQALAVTNFVLSQSDPEYRKLTETLDKE